MRADGARLMVDECPEPPVRGLLAYLERGADNGPGVSGRPRFGDGRAEVLLCGGEGAVRRPSPALAPTKLQKSTQV